MKKYLIFFFILGFMSCNDYLDINNDPNRATSADPGPLFTGTITQYSTNRVIDLGPALSTATQLWSGGGSLGAGVFTRPENYTFSIFTTGNTWRAHYREMQKNLALAIDGAQEVNDNNAEAQCRIIRALTYYSSTVLWGDIPFTEAVDVDFENVAINNLNPAFDPQAVVFDGIIAELNQALALIDGPQSNAIASADLLYSGNMENWRKFAKSLMFRTYMTMVDVNPAVEGELNKLLEEGDMISTAAEAAVFPFFDQPGNRNPFWGTLNTFAGGANFFYFAAEEMVDIMKDKNDPRLETYFVPYPGGGSPEEVVGAPAGVTSIGFTPWVLSTSLSGNALVRPSSPDVIFSLSEQLLLEAEAIARGLGSGGLALANERFEAGILASMPYTGVDPTAAAAYVEALPDLQDVGTETALAMIADEIFVDCIIRPLEGFTHWRRTDMPQLSLPAQAVTAGLIKRLPYPPDELAANSNAPEILPNVDEPMYFDVK